MKDLVWKAKGEEIENVCNLKSPVVSVPSVRQASWSLSTRRVELHPSVRHRGGLHVTEVCATFISNSNFRQPPLRKHFHRFNKARQSRRKMTQIMMTKGGVNKWCTRREPWTWIIHISTALKQLKLNQRGTFHFFWSLKCFWSITKAGKGPWMHPLQLASASIH